MSSKFTHRPMSSYVAIRGKEPLPKHDEDLRITLDRDMGRIYDSHASLHSTAIKAPAFGGSFATNSGFAVVTGSLLAIPTGLSNVDHVVASLVAGNGSPLNFWVTSGKSATGPVGTIDIYIWQPTSAADNTPIACTQAISVHWSATGNAVTTT